MNTKTITNLIILAILALALLVISNFRVTTRAFVADGNAAVATCLYFGNTQIDCTIDWGER